MTLAIETSGLAYRADRKFEMRDLSLHVPSGSIYGFLGPNGAGKTTAIRLLMGMLRPRAGTIAVLGRDPRRGAPEILARTGYVPERPHLYPSLTVAQVQRLHASFFPSWNGRWADDLTDRFGLDRDRPLSRLSKGEMGKVMILLALAQTPELLVLDEPTDGLDPVVRRDVLTAVLDYVADRAATVFISSHLVHELERVCDWVGVLEQGRLIAELPMQSFKNGIKRLRVARLPAPPVDAPFVSSRPSPGRRSARNLGRSWLGAGDDVSTSRRSAPELRDVIDLDLEEAFVELLRSARHPLA